ncbi:MAG: tRNA pseudouridine(55) synthase TruB [Pyrinomonadaceae bacterium]
MNGAFIIDKPAGITSHDVVARVRKIIGERRVGHTGTLDPFATGVLVILVGRATRLAQFLSGAEKEYEAVIRLGYQTDTGDMTGTRLPANFSSEAESPTEPHRDQIETAMSLLTGEIDQTPPMYSAKKIGGRKLYELARKGEEVAREPVRITVRKFEAIPADALQPKQNSDGTSDIKVRVVCSAGTYIRTLAEDLGKHLGVGAHLVELRRIRAGTFRIEEAITLEQLAELLKSNTAESKVIPPDTILSHLPAIDLTADQVTRTIHGIDLSADDYVVLNWEDGAAVRMRSPDNQLIAVGSYDESQNAVHPKVVIADVSEARP